MKIIIKPKSKRAKERVKQHGSEMELVRHDNFRGEQAVLVQSVDRTCGNKHWHGWFRTSEASWS
jgi:hypothetical protein